MKNQSIPKESIPYFCWDRSWTVKEIQQRLSNAPKEEWLQLAAWIMREARFGDVWQFLTPRQVDQSLAELKRYLKPKDAFWEYIFKTWHELGKL